MAVVIKLANWCRAVCIISTYTCAPLILKRSTTCCICHLPHRKTAINSSGLQLQLQSAQLVPTGLKQCTEHAALGRPSYVYQGIPSTGPTAPDHQREVQQREPVWLVTVQISAQFAFIIALLHRVTIGMHAGDATIGLQPPCNLKRQPFPCSVDTGKPQTF
jgi:hypothetical protein